MDATGHTVVVTEMTSVVIYVVISEAGHFGTVVGQAVIVDRFVV